jgi:hypothetical protein
MRRLVTVVLLGAAFLPGADSAAGLPSAGPPTAGYSASARGSVVDASVPAGRGSGVTSVAVSDARAAVASSGLRGGRRSFGRAAGVDVALLPAASAGTALTLAGVAEAAAPPAGPLVTREVGPLQAGPVAYASLLRAQAEPAWTDRGCVIGRPLGLGVGSVADVQVLSLDGASIGPFRRALLGLDAGPPSRRVLSQSTALTYLAPNGAGGFGLVSEVRQTLAPITLLKGLPGEVTIEILGELVLRAFAGGQPGMARVEYGPSADRTPTAPALRIVSAASVVELTTQQVFGGAGLTLALSPAVELRIGAAPRPASGTSSTASSTGTSAGASVEVIDARLLGPFPGLDVTAVDLRIGHLEATAQVPSGGVTCPLPVRKTSTAATVGAGEPFGFDISVPARPDALDGLSCDLVGIRAEDTVQASNGVRFTLTSASPGGSVSGPTARWDDAGDYHPGDPPRVLNLTGRVDPGSPSGVLRDTVVVTADLARCTGGATRQPLMGFPTTGRAALRGSFTLVGPRFHR